MKPEELAAKIESGQTTFSPHLDQTKMIVHALYNARRADEFQRVNGELNTELDSLREQLATAKAGLQNALAVGLPTRADVIATIDSMARYHCEAADGHYSAWMEPGDGDYINFDDTLRELNALYMNDGEGKK